MRLDRFSSWSAHCAKSDIRLRSRCLTQDLRKSSVAPCSSGIKLVTRGKGCYYIALQHYEGFISVGLLTFIFGKDDAAPSFECLVRQAEAPFR